MHLPLIYRTLMLGLASQSPYKRQASPTYSLLPEVGASMLGVESGECLDQTARLAVPEEGEANCVDLVSNGQGGIYTGDGSRWLTLNSETAEQPHLVFVTGEQPNLLWRYDGSLADPIYFQNLCLSGSETDECIYGRSGWDTMPGTEFVVPSTQEGGDRQGANNDDSLGLVLMRADEAEA
ncbi:hypothetical protein BDW68DRAFT_176500 [Aspergillus falconensis]